MTARVRSRVDGPEPVGRDHHAPTGGSTGLASGTGRHRADLRLAWLALGCWLAVLVVLRAAPGTAVAAGAAAFGVAGALGAVHWWAHPARHGHLRVGRAAPALRVMLAVLLGAGVGALSTAARTQVRDDSDLSRLAADGAVVRADLTLTRDPRRLRRTTFAGETWMVTATMRRYVPLAEHRVPTRLRARVLVFGTDRRWDGLLPGQRVSVTARLDRPQGRDLTVAVLSVRTAPHRDGRPPWYQRAAGHLRAGLRAACRGLPEAPGGLLPGLVDGDTSTLDPAVKEDFVAAGMTHLTAVSGSNLAMVTAFVLLLARWGRAGPRLAALAGLSATVGFVILARPDPSVLRAALMGGIGLIALAVHRPRASLPILGATAFVLLATDPQLAVEWGFTLSVLATLGLLLFAPVWRDALRRRGVPAGVAEVVSVSLAAHVATAPAIAAFTSTLGVSAVPANILAEPAVAPATVLGVGAAVLSPVTPAGAHLLAWLASWPCRWLVLVAHHAAHLPAAVLPWPGGVSGGLLLAVLLLGFVVLAGYPTARRILLVVALAAVLGAAPVRLLGGAWPPPGWVFVACDVGQGDALVLNVGRGQGVVVDTGREPTAVDRCLGQLGVRSVPLLVLTHDDADHVGGVAGVFRDRHVAAVAVSRFRGTAGGRGQVLRAARRHRLIPFAPQPDWHYRAGPATFSVLETTQVLTGTESDTNNNCVVLRVTVRGVSLLLTGDAGPEEQAALRREGAPLHAEILKVPHHGSAHQDPGFVDAVAPRVAVVSVGADNDYGQPSPRLLSRLHRKGIDVVRTDRDGDVAVVATGSGGIALARHGITPGRG